MISEEQLAQEFTRVVARVYPNTGQLLQSCYVKVLDFHIRRLRKRFYYIAIYCPDRLIPEVQAQRNLLKEIAENMDLLDVVCINATKLIRDPLSNLPIESPRFWLELNWIASERK